MHHTPIQPPRDLEPDTVFLDHFNNGQVEIVAVEPVIPPQKEEPFLLQAPVHNDMGVRMIPVSCTATSVNFSLKRKQEHLIVKKTREVLRLEFSAKR